MEASLKPIPGTNPRRRLGRRLLSTATDQCIKLGDGCNAPVVGERPTTNAPATGYGWKNGWRTLSPTFSPIAAAVPPFSSSTAAQGPPDGMTRSLQRLGVRRDARHRARTRDEDDVERDIGVLHPEGCRSVAVELEQHAAVGGHVAPVHEAAFAGCVVLGDFDLKRMPPGRGRDFQAPRARRRGRGRRRRRRRRRRRTAPPTAEPRSPSSPPLLLRTASSIARQHSRRRAFAGFKSNAIVSVKPPSRQTVRAPRRKRRSVRGEDLRAVEGPTSAAMSPFGPGPNRASMVSPGLGSTKP